jgi:hypothetical protein
MGRGIVFIISKAISVELRFMSVAIAALDGFVSL